MPLDITETKMSPAQFLKQQVQLGHHEAHAVSTLEKKTPTDREAILKGVAYRISLRGVN